jgi:hypothetical protein
MGLTTVGDGPMIQHREQILPQISLWARSLAIRNITAFSRNDH